MWKCLITSLHIPSSGTELHDQCLKEDRGWTNLFYPGSEENMGMEKELAVTATDDQLKY